MSFSVIQMIVMLSALIQKIKKKYNCVRDKSGIQIVKSAKLVEEQMQDRAAVAENAFFHDEYYEQTEKFKL